MSTLWKCHNFQPAGFKLYSNAGGSSITSSGNDRYRNTTLPFRVIHSNHLIAMTVLVIGIWYSFPQFGLYVKLFRPISDWLISNYIAHPIAYSERYAIWHLVRESSSRWIVPVPHGRRERPFQRSALRFIQICMCSSWEETNDIYNYNILTRSKFAFLS